MTDTTVRIHLLTQFVDGAGPEGLHGAELPARGRSARSPRTPEERVLVSSVSTRATSEVLAVVLSGDVDLLLGAELGLVLEEARAHCRAHRRARVHVDVSDVAAVDATAVRFLAELRRRAEAAGGSVAVVGARPAVQRVLDLARSVPSGELAAS